MASSVKKQQTGGSCPPEGKGRAGLGSAQADGTRSQQDLDFPLVETLTSYLTLRQPL